MTRLEQLALALVLAVAVEANDEIKGFTRVEAGELGTTDYSMTFKKYGTCVTLPPSSCDAGRARLLSRQCVCVCVHQWRRAGRS